MSQASCKQVICNSNLAATLESINELAAGPQLRQQSGEFTEGQLLAMADEMDKANKRIQKIAFGDD